MTMTENIAAIQDEAGVSLLKKARGAAGTAQALLQAEVDPEDLERDAEALDERARELDREFKRIRGDGAQLRAKAAALGALHAKVQVLVTAYDTFVSAEAEYSKAGDAEGAQLSRVNEAVRVADAAEDARVQAEVDDARPGELARLKGAVRDAEDVLKGEQEALEAARSAVATARRDRDAGRTKIRTAIAEVESAKAQAASPDYVHPESERGLFGSFMDSWVQGAMSYMQQGARGR